MCKMKITLVPIAGLCNRMNAITSGLLYQQHNPGCELKIFWWKTHDCCADFHDLFEQLPPPFVKICKLKSFIKDRPASARNLKIPRLFRRLFYDFEMTPAYNADDFDNLVQGKERVFVACHNRFNKYCLKKSLAKVFVPVKDLRERIHEVTKDWNGNVVGLHIRRTDNQRAIENSPMEHFFQLMDEEILKNEKVRFYLASDDDTVKQELKEKYGDRIITLQLSLRRNSVQGMKDAVVDLYCLGATSKIFGSYASTYSIIASQLNNIEIIT